MPDDSGVGNQVSSEMPDLAGDFDRKTGTPLFGSGEPITGDIQFSDMNAPMPNYSGVGNLLPSEMPDLAGDFDKKTLSGSGEPITGDIQFSDMDDPMPYDSGVGNHSDLACDLDPNTEVIHSLHICLHGRWDRDNLVLAGL